MITKRDLEIFKFINRYGKSYIEVLSQTIFVSEQAARNRMNVLKKQNYINYWNTNLMKPRRALILNDEIKTLLNDEYDIKPKNAKLNKSTIHHNMIEQIADYHLSKIENSEVIRTTVFEHSKIFHHIPDLFLKVNNLKIFIEVETSKKSNKRYIELFSKMQKDNIDMVIYIVENQDILKSFASTFPKFDKLYFITINELIENIKSKNKLNAKSQNDAAADLSAK